MSDTPTRRRPHGPWAGFRIGILTLDTRHRLVAGNVQNSESFGYPVLYEIVKGVSGPELMSGSPDASTAIISAARTLEAAGVDVIVGACGSFAFFQQEVARSVSVPVFLSILLEVPLLLRALPPQQQLGIVFASTSSFTERVRAQCGIVDESRIVAVGADSVREFREILEQGRDFDDSALESGLIELARATLRTHPAIGMWLIQCSDLPPYAWGIQSATGLPVFDMVTLIDHVHAALTRRPFAGSRPGRDPAR